jgi:Domain of unknown function (DUF1772)
MLLLVRLVMLFAAGLLAGSTICVWLLEHSFAGTGAFFTEFKQLEIRAFTAPLSGIGLVALLAGLAHAALVRRSRSALALTLAGVLSLGIGAFITAGTHFPMNDRIAAWSSAAAPAEWTNYRARWRRAHDLRTGVVLVAFGLFLVAALPADRRSAATFG